MVWQEYLSTDPKICGGQVCATGTRVPVTVILDSLAEGTTPAEILHSYSTLRPEHIDAALAYAAELARGVSASPTVSFKIDENLPTEVGEELRALGYSADSVAEEGLAGATDSAVVAAAHSANRIVLTLDKGTADVLRFPNGAHPGIVLFRPGSLGLKAVLRYIRKRLGTLLRLE